MMTKDSYMNGKRKYASIVAAVLLSGFQLYAFMTGMNIGDNSVLIGAVLWLALFLIQMVGNDFAEEDAVFKAGWLFSYVVEITAGTWAIHALMEIPDTSIVLVSLRWVFAVGLSGVVALLPERLLMVALSPSKKKTASDFPLSRSSKDIYKPKPLPPQNTQKKEDKYRPFIKNPATKYDPLGVPDYKERKF